MTKKLSISKKEKNSAKKCSYLFAIPSFLFCLLRIIPCVEAEDIYVPGSYTTISAAISAASDGDNIYVSTGIYSEKITVTQGIALIGLGTPTINPSTHGNAVTFQGSSSNNAFLTGFIITGATHDPGTEAVDGHGICCEDGANPTIATNTITNNYWHGIACYDSSPKIVNNQITAQTNGDGVFCKGSYPVIDNNTISSNYYGISCYSYSSPNILNNTISGNTGCGIYCWTESAATIINNLIINNSYVGISCDWYAHPQIINNTINGHNTCGIYCSGYSYPQIFNNIITNNSQIGIGCEPYSTPIINYNDVWGHSNNYSGCTKGAKDISYIPNFLWANDYHLSPSSVCRDRGDNNVIVGVTTDKDGNPRIAYGIVDMGAYEFQEPLEIVDIIASVQPDRGDVGADVTVMGTCTVNGVGTQTPVWVDFEQQINIAVTTSNDAGTFAATFTIPSEPYGQRTITVRSEKCGFTTLNFLVIETYPIIASIGGIIISKDGKLKLEISPDSLPSDATFTLTSTTSPPLPPGKEGIGLRYEIEPEGTTFNPPATMTLYYEDVDQDGIVDNTTIDETKLQIYRYKNGTWTSLGGIVDTASNTVSTQIGSLSTFTIGGSLPHLLISEVYYDPPGTETNNECIEIFNPNSSSINLSDWKIGDHQEKGTGTNEGMYKFPPGAVILPYATITIALKATGFKVLFDKNPDFETTSNTDSDVPNMIKYDSWSTGSIYLSNAGDEVLLVGPSDIVVDVVTYKNGSYTGVISHPGVGEGQSLQRQPPNQDTDNCSIDFGSGTPTPIILRNILVSPTSGTIGSFVTITGQGFFATEGILIDFGTTSTIATTTTDVSGSFSTIFTATLQPDWGTVSVSAKGLTSQAKITTEFKLIMAIPPTITITHPFSPGAQADTSYLIGWQDDDPDSNATITLYYDNNNTGTDGTQIVTDISEDDETDYYQWDTSGPSFAQGSSYYIYARIDDGVNPPVYIYSPGAVIIDHRQPDGKTLPWHSDGRWLIGDIHLHTNMSDGSYPAGTVAQYAANYGADFIAITDHGDSIKSKLNTYHSPILNARNLFPNLVIFEGVEWNVPGAGVGGHAVVLTTNSPREHEIISSFTTTFDSVGTNTDAVAGLQWLATCKTNDVIPICSLNHPSRNTDVNPTGFRLDQLRAYSEAGSVCIGFSGDVGHKKDPTVIGYAQTGGGYHDPMTAFIGNNWDTLLNENRNWWIRFENDFHGTSSDYCPGEFAQTRVYCPSKTYEGVIKGLRAGCAYTVHNNIITDLDFRGLAGTQSAMMGEVIQVTQGDIVTASIRVKPSTDTTIDKIELISNVSGTSTSTQIFATWTVNGNWLEMSYPFTNVQNDFYFRVRGSSSATPVNLWFYSNPIRVKISPTPLLGFTKTVTFVGTPSSGATLTYTLYYKNEGLGTATNVVLTDAIPDGTTYITDSAVGVYPATYSHDGGINYDSSQTSPVTHIRWNLNIDIAPGGSGNASFAVRVE